MKVLRTDYHCDEGKKMDEIVTFSRMRHILMAVSWGGHESLATPRCASLEPEEFDSSDREHHMIRFYVGLEEPDYLIPDMEQAFRYFIISGLYWLVLTPNIEIYRDRLS